MSVIWVVAIASVWFSVGMGIIGYCRRARWKRRYLTKTIVPFIIIIALGLTSNMQYLLLAPAYALSFLVMDTMGRIAIRRQQPAVEEPRT